ncbi:MAG: hypothetical protein OEW78_00270 [Nitrosopumilus sp.]|uniref:hypothetical protein n=1 Tax=Nitrosopumilus sp. TaxID=2024843 RepID=UPI00246D41E4|nr:hypothetical protein [Nitrosopumilus sp.]MDH5430304.1 hypothetical protein [Nitrosopumilus sp.]
MTLFKKNATLQANKNNLLIAPKATNIPGSYRECQQGDCLRLIPGLFVRCQDHRTDMAFTGLDCLTCEIIRKMLLHIYRELHCKDVFGEIMGMYFGKRS